MEKNDEKKQQIKTKNHRKWAKMKKTSLERKKNFVEKMKENPLKKGKGS